MKLKAGEFELSIEESTRGVAYLRLPSFDEKLLPMSRTIALTSLVGEYNGPSINLDFDRTGKLVGIEIF